MIINIIHCPEHFFEGSYPKEIDAAIARKQSFMEEMATQRAKYIVWNGIIDRPTFKGVSLAHKAIVQDAKHTNQPAVCIMEDDCKFSHPQSYKYFLKNIPKDFDLYCGLIYQGTLGEDNRITNGASGILTIYIVSQRFYDVFLNINPQDHLDRALGEFAYKYKYYVCDPMICVQAGGYSYNKKQFMQYDEYLNGRTLFTG